MKRQNKQALTQFEINPTVLEKIKIKDYQETQQENVFSHFLNSPLFEKAKRKRREVDKAVMD